MPFHRARRTLRGKSYEKHSDTLVSVIGPGTATIPVMLVRDTEVGDRDPAGGNDTIQLGRGLGEECNIGDSCKFVTIHIQAGPRLVDDLASMGWLEWGFVCHKNSDTAVAKTNLGTNTLGDILTKYFRNECIMTGNLPLSSSGCSSQEIALKIPKSKIQMRIGDVWEFIFAVRTVSTTETGTNTFKVLTSFNFKNYH